MDHDHQERLEMWFPVMEEQEPEERRERENSEADRAAKTQQEEQREKLIATPCQPVTEPVCQETIPLVPKSAPSAEGQRPQQGSTAVGSGSVTAPANRTGANIKQAKLNVVDAPVQSGTISRPAFVDLPMNVNYLWAMDVSALTPTTAIVDPKIHCTRCLLTLGSEPDLWGFVLTDMVPSVSKNIVCFKCFLVYTDFYFEVRRCAICTMNKVDDESDCIFVQTKQGSERLYAHNLCYNARRNKCELCNKPVAHCNRVDSSLDGLSHVAHHECIKQFQVSKNIQADIGLQVSYMWEFLTTHTEWNGEAILAERMREKQGMKPDVLKRLLLAQVREDFRKPGAKVVLKPGVKLNDPNIQAVLKKADLRSEYFLEAMEKVIIKPQEEDADIEIDFFDLISYLIDIAMCEDTEEAKEEAIRRYALSRATGAGVSCLVAAVVGAYRGWKPLISEESKPKKHAVVEKLEYACAALGVAGAGFALAATGVEAAANVTSTVRSIIAFMDIIDRIGEPSDDKPNEKARYIKSLRELSGVQDDNVFSERYAKQPNDFKKAYPYTPDRIEECKTAINNDLQNIILQDLERIKNSNAFEVLQPLRSVCMYVWEKAKIAIRGIFRLAKDPTTYGIVAISAACEVIGEWIGAELYAWYYTQPTKFFMVNGKPHVFATPKPGQSKRLVPYVSKKAPEAVEPLENERAIIWLHQEKPVLQQEAKQDGETRNTKAAQKAAAKRSRGAPKVQYDEYETWVGLGERIEAGERLGSNLMKRFNYLDHKSQTEGLWRGDGAKYDIEEGKWTWPNGRGGVVVTSDRRNDDLVDRVYYQQDDYQGDYKPRYVDGNESESVKDQNTKSQYQNVDSAAPTTEMRKLNQHQLAWLELLPEKTREEDFVAAITKEAAKKQPPPIPPKPKKELPLITPGPKGKEPIVLQPECVECDVPTTGCAPRLVNADTSVRVTTTETLVCECGALIHTTSSRRSSISVMLPEAVQPIVNTMCDDCLLKMCVDNFKHQKVVGLFTPEAVPAKKKQVNFQPVKKRCKDSDGCKNPDCRFMHPTRVLEAKRTFGDKVRNWERSGLIFNSVAKKMQTYAGNDAAEKAICKLMAEKIGEGNYPNAQSYSGKFRKWDKEQETAAQPKEEKKKTPPTQIPPAPVTQQPVIMRRAAEKPKEAPARQTESVAKTAGQAVDSAALPRNYKWIAFNLVERGQKGKPSVYNIYVKQPLGNVTIYKRAGFLGMRDHGGKVVYKFNYTLPNNERVIYHNSTLTKVYEQNAQGKEWYVEGIHPDDPELAQAHPYVMTAIQTLEQPALPPANPGVLRPENASSRQQEGVSRNGFIPTSLVQCLVNVYDNKGRWRGNAVRAGGHGITAKHVVMTCRAATGKDEIVLNTGTDTANVTTFGFEEYDLAYFAWPRKASFQTVKSASLAGDVAHTELPWKRKVGVVARMIDGTVEVPGVSTGHALSMDTTNNKVCADYSTPGEGSSGAPVFMEVNPGVWHLVGIHIEYDNQNEKCYFTLITPEVRKRLNYQSPPLSN